MVFNSIKTVKLLFTHIPDEDITTDTMAVLGQFILCCQERQDFTFFNLLWSYPAVQHLMQENASTGFDLELVLDTSDDQKYRAALQSLVRSVQTPTTLQLIQPRGCNSAQHFAAAINTVQNQIKIFLYLYCCSTRLRAGFSDINMQNSILLMLAACVDAQDPQHPPTPVVFAPRP